MGTPALHFQATYKEPAAQHGLNVVHNPRVRIFNPIELIFHQVYRKGFLRQSLDYEVYQKPHPIIALEFHFHSITFLKLLSDSSADNGE
jgi:hypothetical protein